MHLYSIDKVYYGDHSQSLFIFYKCIAQYTVYAVHVVCIIYAKMAIYDCIPYTIYISCMLTYIFVDICMWFLLLNAQLWDKRKEKSSKIYDSFDIGRNSKSLLISSLKFVWLLLFYYFVHFLSFTTSNQECNRMTSHSLSVW